MSWKPALYQYVEAAGSREAQLAADDAPTPAERERLLRLSAGFAERGAAALGGETRLVILRAREDEREVTADIELRKTIRVSTRGVRHQEERVDRERVTLRAASDGTWSVVRAVPRLREGGPDTGWPVSDAVRGIRTDGRLRAGPFLNERVLAGSGARAGRARSGRRYDREAARDYADRHWNEPNAQFIHFTVDCTNYVSQCLYAGGAPMHYTGGRESGWWYRGKSGGREQWSYSWTVAHALQWYLSGNRSEGLAAERVASPEMLTVGDVICYDFDGDGRFEHTAFVTGSDGAGMPLVNAHTTNSRRRYWDYRDSYAWTERTTYRFFRIRDQF